ncbi:ABC transporter permease [Roseicitreum antarcticum]|uniref:Peptide/nickel transport system permease protein n=1 Tax=Roseicitreum antarcticum TaxID=564137 RepID=A0A1H2VR49_9RHOB|nr:ABC transporter permease [Roseicitreum antarcticum]SDW70882.1 peptide/nickel transport system permease protein [Roseicitreum antarcticum]
MVYIIRRLMQAVFLAAVMSFVVFAGIYAVGSPVDILIDPEATQAERLRLIAQMGLDRPFHEQYLVFMGNVLQGDFGNSFIYNRPALGLILERMPATLELAFAAIMIAVVLGLPLGVYAGLRPGSVGSQGIMAGSILGFSVPNFWQAIMLIMVFAVMLGWFPVSGRGEVGEFLGIRSSLFTLDGLQHITLPAVNLAIGHLALVIRLARSGVREVEPQDYIRFARAKGLSERRVVFVHILRNILIPIVTVVGMSFGGLIAFAVVTESIFAWPGMGKLIIDSIQLLDRPVVVAYLIVIVVLFIIINLVVDLLYSLIDPRIRIDGGKA